MNDELKNKIEGIDKQIFRLKLKKELLLEMFDKKPIPKRKCRGLSKGSIAYQAYHVLLDMEAPLTAYEIASLLNVNTKDGIYNINRALQGWVEKGLYFNYHTETEKYIIGNTNNE